MAQKFTVPITVKQLTSAGSDAITVYVDADTYARLKIEAGGRLTWGTGSGAGDVNLYRDSADVLKTDDTFKTPALYVDNIEIDPTGATTDQVLKFNGTKFIASTVSSGSSNLDDLSNVTVPSPNLNDVLTYNGSVWTSASVAAGGGASVTVAETPPASPSTGDLWFESDTSRTYVYYDSFWIEIGGVAPGATVSDTAPSSPVTGQVWFNSLNGGTYVYYSSAWAEVGAVPVNNLLNLLDAKGDLFVGSADNTAAKLSVGTNGQVLMVDPSATYGVKWAAIPPSGGLSTTTEGAIMTMAIGA